MANKVYYLAYGSNLNLNQMKYRCPRSRRVGTMMLDDYELEFKLYLNVKKSKGKKVPIGIWEVDEQDERRLDVYEGYPTFYRKEYIPITINGEQVEALIYIMNDVRDVQPPTRIYLETCIQGYKDFGFDTEFLKQALLNSKAV